MIGGAVVYPALQSRSMLVLTFKVIMTTVLFVDELKALRAKVVLANSKRVLRLYMW